MAAELHGQLIAAFADIKVDLKKTERAGHATEIAEEVARASSNPLLISVSGDGGYNEVINGAMRASDTASPICAVYPAGNANDHRRTLKQSPLLDAIIHANVRRIDLLRMDVTAAGEGSDNMQTRYAHSYIGLGLTPVTAVELNKHSLNALKELGLVLRTFYRHQPFAIELPDGQRKKLDSLVFANIKQMAKVLKLSDDGHPADGRFELIELPRLGKIRLLASIIKAALFGLGRQPQAERYQFRAIEAMPIQLDGEVMELKAGSQVRVTVAPQAMRTIV